MNQVDGVSNMVSLLFGSVLGRAQKGDNSCCLASGVLSKGYLSPSTCPDANHFSFSPYATSDIPGGSLGCPGAEAQGESVCVSPKSFADPL